MVGDVCGQHEEPTRIDAGHHTRRKGEPDRQQSGHVGHRRLGAIANTQQQDKQSSDERERDNEGGNNSQPLAGQRSTFDRR